jgi:chromosome segregation ATPase
VLGFHETSNNALTNELGSVRSKLQQVLDDKASIEKSLHQLQLQLSSLEYSNDNKEKTISQTEESRISAEKVSADAKRTLSSQHSQMEDLRRRLAEAELETSKYKDLTSRYQTNRLEMKKRLKEKVEVIREQEDVLVVKEKETSELKAQVRGLEEKLQRTQAEKDAASRELNDAVRQRKEDVKKLENNQQVRLVLSFYS